MAHIVMVHGAWHGAWCWEDHVAPALRERGHAVHTFDLPGHDRPGDTRRNWSTVGSYLDAVDAVVASTGVARDELVLVGHSMGGYTVQRYLERGSARTGVLVASVPRRGAFPANLRLMREEPRAVLAATTLLDYHRLVDTPQKVRDLFLSDDAPPTVVDALAGRLQSESALAILTMVVRPPRPARVTTPVRVIAAEDDTIFTLEEQHALAAAYGTEAVVLPGAHDLMVDAAWPQLADAIDTIAAG